MSCHVTHSHVPQSHWQSPGLVRSSLKRNEESTTAYCQSEYQLPIGAVSLYDCMPQTATPILRSTTLTAQARDRTQCQCPFRSPP
eukprot:3285183-Rhodomonas_salina.3